jgi:hypothetical protein
MNIYNSPGSYEMRNLFSNMGYYNNLFRLYDENDDEVFRKINIEYNKFIQSTVSFIEIKLKNIKLGFIKEQDGVIIGLSDLRLPPNLNKSYYQIKRSKPRFKLKGNKIIPIIRDFDSISVLETEEIFVNYENSPLNIYTSYEYIETYHNPKTVATDMIYIPGKIYSGASMQVVEWEHKPAYTSKVVNIDKLDSDLRKNYILLLKEFEYKYNRNTEFINEYKDKIKVFDSK